MRCVSRRFARCFLSLFINRGSGSILWCLFSRKERSVSLNFPGHLHQTAVRQPIHLGSFDLEKYLQQTFSVAKKSTDFLKFFLCSIPEWKEPRVKCHIIGFSESGIIGQNGQTLAISISRAQEGYFVNGLVWPMLASHAQRQRKSGGCWQIAASVQPRWQPGVPTVRLSESALAHLFSPLTIHMYILKQRTKSDLLQFSTKLLRQWKQSQDYLTLDLTPLAQSLTY